MSRIYRGIVIAALAGAIAGVLVLKQQETASDVERGDLNPEGPALPRLVDLGAGQCASCKMMMPVLAELKREFADVFSVTFIDVWEQTEAAEQYGIRMIPTQIFYDAAGKELFRHEGFFSREDILATWRRHGVMPGPPGGRALPDTQPTPAHRPHPM
ncbi:MAG: thioredoxin family protein [Kiritimatiellia bacterium]|jgi:thioredoxin 1|nr:thioredoxin family protein [Kiritimatiellia bacterium]MDP6809499.1 thioredoxin family protein [Kiritimatiellia bacterium]MDP7023824.1 thioredoxin family protein [Kiritimatiellia bacterium]